MLATKGQNFPGPFSKRISFADKLKTPLRPGNSTPPTRLGCTLLVGRFSLATTAWKFNLRVQDRSLCLKFVRTACMHYIAKTFDCLCVLESWVLIVFLLTSFDLLLEVLQTVMAFLLLILRCSGQTNPIVIGVFIINIITTTTTTNSKEFLDLYSISWRFVSPTVTIECKSDTEIFDDFSENMKPDDFLFLAVVFVVFCLDVYFFRYGWSGLSNAAIDTFSIEELPAPCTLYFTELAPDILLFVYWIFKKKLAPYTLHSLGS